MNSAKEKLSHVRLEFPLKEAKSVDGIISYLTRKHGGNVHGKGIATITSKSVMYDAPNMPRGMPLISLLTHVSSQRTSHVSGFAGISMKCASA
jgi:hypothetical protein